MKIKWKKFKHNHKYQLNKWIKHPHTKIITSIDLDEIFQVNNSHLIKYSIYIGFHFIAVIVLEIDNFILTVNTLIINPKYLDELYGKAILSDLYNKRVLLTNSLVNRICIRITSDNHFALKLLKEQNYKLDRIIPLNNEFEFSLNE